MQLKFLTRLARAAIVAIAVIFGTLLAGNGTASAGVCDAYAKKELYNCLATKLDHVASMSYRSPETQAALQKAAMAAGVAPGTIRELSARGTGKEIASIQFDGAGNVQGLMSLLYHLPTLGYPLLLDEMQITSDGRMPGAVKFHLTIAVIDFEQWSQSHETQPGA